mgnify:FL=1
MNAIALTAPADVAGQPDSLRRTLPEPATCLADPDHD